MTDILQQIEVVEKCIADLREVATSQKQSEDNSKAAGGDDSALLHECLDVLQIATYHDGRYDQYMRETWQAKAQELVSLLAKRLAVWPTKDVEMKTTATMEVPTLEGMTDGMEALLASCRAGKWTLLAPDGRVWMNADPMILFAALTQIMEGRELKFDGVAR